MIAVVQLPELTGTLVGGILIGVCGIWYHRKKRFLARSRRTQGTVTDVIVEDTGNSDRFFRVIVEFTDSEGVTRRIKSNTSNRLRSKSDCLQVRYDPEDPSKAVIDTFTEVWMGFAVCTGFAAAIFALSIVALTLSSGLSK